MNCAQQNECGHSGGWVLRCSFSFIIFFRCVGPTFAKPFGRRRSQPTQDTSDGQVGLSIPIVIVKSYLNLSSKK